MAGKNWLFDRIKDWNVYINQSNGNLVLYSPSKDVCFTDDTVFETSEFMLKFFGFKKLGTL